jgi:hypothetical protein
MASKLLLHSYSKKKAKEMLYLPFCFLEWSGRGARKITFFLLRGGTPNATVASGADQ